MVYRIIILLLDGSIRNPFMNSYSPLTLVNCKVMFCRREQRDLSFKDEAHLFNYWKTGVLPGFISRGAEKVQAASVCACDKLLVTACDTQARA